MPKFGKRSKERLRGVDTRLVNVLNELIKIMDVTIIEGDDYVPDITIEDPHSTTWDVTIEFEGKTKTKFSKHIEGKAVDLAPYPIDWEDRDRFHYMGGMIRGIAKQLNINVRWGGDWDSDGETKDNRFDDLVHVEIRD